MEKVIIAVDSGGSKTKVCIIDYSKKILDTYIGQSGSPAVIGEEKAMNNIHEGIFNLYHRNKDNYDITSIAMGVSGLGVIKDKSQYEKRYFEEFNIPVYIESDATLALYSIVQDIYEEGVLVLSGTGAAILGINHGKMQLMSGWGHLLTEQGSAFSVVRDMICNTIRYFEKTGKMNKLGLEFMKYMNFSRLEDFRNFTYQNTKREIAYYSRFVNEMAIKYNNKDAIKLLKKAGIDLSKDVRNVTRALKLSSNAVLGFRGGFIDNSKITQNELINNLNKFGINFKIIEGDSDPIYGALYISKRREQ